MTPIVKHYAGSISYGTNIAASDVDFRGIFCADKDIMLSPFRNIREMTLPNEEDSKLYELTNYIAMYTEANPNIIESLWVDPKHLVESSEVYNYLRNNAPALLSSRVRHTFSGYAFSQLKRIKGHNKWINNPQPEASPNQSDFLKLIQNFREEQIFGNKWVVSDWADDHALIPYGNNVFGIAPMKGHSLLNRDMTLKKVKYEDVSEEMKKEKPAFIVKYCEDEYRKAKEVHRNYWNWVNNRNEKRSALEQEYGYDTKHAMHLVRLLRMGVEILRDGEVNVWRHDAGELLDVRNGKWKYDDLIAYADSLESEMDSHYKSTDLPHKPNIKLAEKVLRTAQDMCWER